jgi:WD40 repeat protein
VGEAEPDHRGARDAGTGDLITVLRGHSERVRSPTYTPDGSRLISASLLEHNGLVATLEDWLDPKRLDDGSVSTGWKGPADTTAGAVQGHEFGLDFVSGR